MGESAAKFLAGMFYEFWIVGVSISFIGSFLCMSGSIISAKRFGKLIGVLSGIGLVLVYIGLIITIRESGGIFELLSLAGSGLFGVCLAFTLTKDTDGKPDNKNKKKNNTKKRKKKQKEQ